jgi:hypothetical protein
MVMVYHNGSELGLGDLGRVEAFDGNYLPSVDVERLVHGSKAASTDQLAHTLSTKHTTPRVRVQVLELATSLKRKGPRQNPKERKRRLGGREYVYFILKK